MAKDEQTEMAGTERRRIRTIENQADKIKLKLGQIGGLKDEVKTHRAKIAELCHENANDLDSEEGVLIYKRAEYDVRVSEKESVSVKIADVVQD